MPLATNSAQQLRLRINDKPRRQMVNLYGDNTATVFELGALPGGIVTGGGALYGPSAYIALTGANFNSGWSATGATFSYPDGMVTFGGVISANSAVQCVFYHGVFSDEEIDYVTGNYGDLNAQTLEVVNTLIGDYSKRASWAGGGVRYDDGATLKNLMEWRTALRAILTTEQGPQGGFESWSDQQDKWG